MRLVGWLFELHVISSTCIGAFCRAQRARVRSTDTHSHLTHMHATEFNQPIAFGWLICCLCHAITCRVKASQSTNPAFGNLGSSCAHCEKGFARLVLEAFNIEEQNGGSTLATFLQCLYCLGVSAGHIETLATRSEAQRAPRPPVERR